MIKEIKKIKNKEMSLNTHYDLFGEFISNNKSDVSNTVEMWEKIPKYFLGSKIADRLRSSEGLAKPYKLEYTEKSSNGFLQKCMVVIQPALIEVDGAFKAFFPGNTEEFIEEALKKILSDQKFGVHDVGNTETWVKFSLNMLHTELLNRGRQRNKNQIKHAISVMNRCNITLYKDNKEVWSGAILQDLVTVGRDDYLEKSDSLHIARLPVFISRAINKLEYRQFNYDRLLQCNGQLTRWIYKKLIHRYKQASPLTKYHFMYSELKGSGLLQQSQERTNRRKALDALEELISKGVLLSYDAEERKAGRKIEDVKYTVIASIAFGKEQAAAHKRKSQQLENLQKIE